MASVEPDPQPAESTDGPPAPPLSEFRQLLPGDPFPWLAQATPSRSRFNFDSLAGRYQLFCFFLDGADAVSRAAIAAVRRRRELFDDRHCSFVGVTLTTADRNALRDEEPGIRFALDLDGSLAKACGAAPTDTQAGSVIRGRRFWVLVGPGLHVLQVFPLASETIGEVMQAVADLPPPELYGGLSLPAPVLILPQVFEPELCRRLIEIYDADGGQDSGVHRGGAAVLDPSFKRRKDCTITDEAVIGEINRRIARRVLPQIERLFFMKARYIERHVVGCYSAIDGGHFAPHRDNREVATAHRRFAISVNLNAGYGGGEVVFPEYNPHGYKAPAGWAVVFPCAILHRVNPVTSGARYAFLPFVHDAGGQGSVEGRGD